MYEYHVLELGGSIISKQDENGNLFFDSSGAIFFKELIEDLNPNHGAIAIIGGGKNAQVAIREKEEEIRKCLEIPLNVNLDDLDFLRKRILRHSLDYIGILKTFENSGEFIKKLNDLGMESVCPEVLKHPFKPLPRNSDGNLYRIYVSGGFKPGATTDAVAAYFAESTLSKVVHKVSDFKRIKDCPVWKYNKLMEDSYPDLYNTSFDYLSSLVGDVNNMVPGGSYPLDPKAISIYKNLIQRDDFKDLTLNVGRLSQLKKMIMGEKFEGTIVKR